MLNFPHWHKIINLDVDKTQKLDSLMDAYIYIYETLLLRYHEKIKKLSPSDKAHFSYYDYLKDNLAYVLFCDDWLKDFPVSFLYDPFRLLITRIDNVQQNIFNHISGIAELDDDITLYSPNCSIVMEDKTTFSLGKYLIDIPVHVNGPMIIVESLKGIEIKRKNGEFKVFVF